MAGYVEAAAIESVDKGTQHAKAKFQNWASGTRKALGLDASKQRGHLSIQTFKWAIERLKAPDIAPLDLVFLVGDDEVQYQRDFAAQCRSSLVAAQDHRRRTSLFPLGDGLPMTAERTNALSVQFQRLKWASLLAVLASSGMAAAMLGFASRGNDPQRQVGVVVDQASSDDSGSTGHDSEFRRSWSLSMRAPW